MRPRIPGLIELQILPIYVLAWRAHRFLRVQTLVEVTIFVNTYWKPTQPDCVHISFWISIYTQTKTQVTQEIISMVFSVSNVLYFRPKDFLKYLDFWRTFPKIKIYSNWYNLLDRIANA
jgi:hypothetical protein